MRVRKFWRYLDIPQNFTWNIDKKEQTARTSFRVRQVDIYISNSFTEQENHDFKLKGFHAFVAGMK